MGLPLFPFHVSIARGFWSDRPSTFSDKPTVDLEREAHLVCRESLFDFAF